MQNTQYKEIIKSKKLSLKLKIQDVRNVENKCKKNIWRIAEKIVNKRKNKCRTYKRNYHKNAFIYIYIYIYMGHKDKDGYYAE